MSLERDLMDLEESLMRNDDCVHQSDYYTIVGLANDAREIEQEMDALKALVQDMYTCVRYIEETAVRWDCTACPLDGTRECDFGGRMSALGIEVTDDR